MSNWLKDKLTELALDVQAKKIEELEAHVKGLNAQIEQWQILSVEVKDKKIEELETKIKQLEAKVEYWRIEAESNDGRWMRVLEDYEKIKKSIYDNGNDTKSGN